MAEKMTPETREALAARLLEAADELQRRCDPGGCTEGTVNGARVPCWAFHIGRPMARWCRSCVLKETADRLRAAAAALSPTPETPGDEIREAIAARRLNVAPRPWRGR